MNMEFKSRVCLLLLLGLICSLPVTASKPRWVQKGEESMNKNRSNEQYEFKVFNTYGMDVDRLHAERYEPLLTYVREQYDAAPGGMTLDSLYSSVDSVMTYRVAFTANGSDAVVYARRVDEYCVYEDYVDNTYQFEYYQLYAVTKKNELPDVFDDFQLTRIYNAKATLMSLVPGLGQIYKGQPAKGYTIMGAEAALVISAVAFNARQNYCHNQIGKYDGIVSESWTSKARSWKQMRNICICLAGGLYVYNLLDAALAKGARQVIVKKPRGRQLSVAPMATFDGAGLSLVLDF